MTTIIIIKTKQNKINKNFTSRSPSAVGLGVVGFRTEKKKRGKEINREKKWGRREMVGPENGFWAGKIGKRKKMKKKRGTRKWEGEKGCRA